MFLSSSHHRLRSAMGSSLRASNPFLNKFMGSNVVASTPKAATCCITTFRRCPNLKLSLSPLSHQRPMYRLVQLQAYRDDNRPPHLPPPPKGGNKWGVIASVGMGASFLLGKAKYVLVGLKLTKAAPLLSMLLSSFAYSLFFGWPYAVGMVGQIFLHECGHAVAMRYYNVPFSPMVFIPFMGAVISMKDLPRNSYQEAVIAIGGPLAGTAAAVGMSAAGVAMDSQMLLALAEFGFLINLFNLMPIGSMDGGRIGNAIHPGVGVVGLIGGAGLIYTGAISNPIFYLIMLSGAYTTTSRIMGWEAEDYPDDYHKISTVSQAQLSLSWLGLIALLLFGMKENNERRLSPKQLQRAADAERDGFTYDLESEQDFGKREDGLVFDSYFEELFRDEEE